MPTTLPISTGRTSNHSLNIIMIWKGLHLPQYSRSYISLNSSFIPTSSSLRKFLMCLQSLSKYNKPISTFLFASHVYISGGWDPLTVCVVFYEILDRISNMGTHARFVWVIHRDHQKIVGILYLTDRLVTLSQNLSNKIEYVDHRVRV